VCVGGGGGGGYLTPAPGRTTIESDDVDCRLLAPLPTAAPAAPCGREAGSRGDPEPD
jgi:hypothetical protein